VPDKQWRSIKIERFFFAGILSVSFIDKAGVKTRQRRQNRLLKGGNGAFIF